MRSGVSTHAVKHLKFTKSRCTALEVQAASIQHNMYPYHLLLFVEQWSHKVYSTISDMWIFSSSLWWGCFWGPIIRFTLVMKTSLHFMYFGTHNLEQRSVSVPVLDQSFSFVYTIYSISWM